MRGAVYVNGTISSPDTAVIPVFDHGFLYGEGVYEVLRTYRRRPFLFDRHCARLRASARHLHLEMPFDDATLREWVERTIAAASQDPGLSSIDTASRGVQAGMPLSSERGPLVHAPATLDIAAQIADPSQPEGELYIRILVTRGVGELTYDVRATPTPSVVIIVKPLDEPPDLLQSPGVRLSLVPNLRNHPGSVNPIIKSNNLLNNAMAMQEANRRGSDEALMCNYRGELAECSQSNLFLVRDGVAVTPVTEAGLLEGITRGFLFEVGQQIGIEVHYATLWPADLDAADEVFITSTTRGITPVIRVDDRVVGDGRPGPVTLRLSEAYQRMALELSHSSPIQERPRP